MSMNVISNYAANVAHRNLMTSDAAATSSLAKLSSGSRVVSAKDDAAAMAIGARLNSTVNALKQASVNAGQGVSMLQIADGAMARVNDVLVRMKTLSVQAGSGQLSSTERGMLDTEYQSLVSEVTRIAAATDFNGQQLVNGSLTTAGAGIAGGAFEVADGVSGITAHGLTSATSDNYTLSYSTTGATFTLSDGTNTYTGSISSSALDSSGALTTGTAVKLTSTGATGDAIISLNTAFDATTSVAAAATDGGLHFTGSSTTSFSYKVGAGTDATKDVITVSVDGINAANLALSGTDITTTTTADAASDLISAAIDTLNTARSKVGAYQNRLEFASANLASAIENSEAARSNLLDLDIAQEMTTFTSKQILTQAGVSMLAQANQMPQNLLKLFQ
jgi:flagellin